MIYNPDNILLISGGLRDVGMGGKWDYAYGDSHYWTFHVVIYENIKLIFLILALINQRILHYHSDRPQ